MWRIQSKKIGQAAYPKNGVGLDGSDISRYAKFILESEKYQITLPLNMFLPKDASKCTHLVFSVHGINRNASKYRNIFVPYLNDSNVLVAAPSFTDAFYKDSMSLKMGNMSRGTKNPTFLPKDEWASTHLHEIYKLLKTEFPLLQGYSLFGHSAGAQFVHRMVIFNNHADLKTAVAANAGWYTSMDDSVDYPYGISKLLDDKNVRLALKKKLVLVVGELDTKQEESLRLTRRTLAQGNNRLERARTFFSVAHKCSDNLKTDFNWKLEVVPNVGHSSRLIVPAVLKYLF